MALEIIDGLDNGDGATEFQNEVNDFLDKSKEDNSGVGAITSVEYKAVPVKDQIVWLYAFIHYVQKDVQRDRERLEKDMLRDTRE